MSLALICLECYRHTQHGGNPFIKKSLNFTKAYGLVLYG